MKRHLFLIASLLAIGYVCPVSMPVLTAAAVVEVEKTDKAKEPQKEDPKIADDKKTDPDKKPKANPDFDPTQPDGILKWLLDQQKKGDPGNQEIMKLLEKERERVREFENKERARVEKQIDELRKQLEEERKKSAKAEEEDRKRIRELEKQNQENERLRVKEQLDELRAGMKTMEKLLEDERKKSTQAEELFKAKVQKIQDEFKSSSPDENRRLKEQLEQEKLRNKKLEEYLSLAERAAKSVVVRGKVIQPGKPGVALVEIGAVDSGPVGGIPEAKGKTKQVGPTGYPALPGSPGTGLGSYQVITEKGILRVGNVIFQVEEMDSAEIRLKVRSPNLQLILR